MPRTARIAAVAATFAVATAAVTGCSSSDNDKATSTPVMPPAATIAGHTTPASSTPSTPGVYQPLDTGKGKSGLEASILSVEDADTRYGPGTVVTFQIVNTTQTPWEGYNWSEPSLVYGPAGTPAEKITSLSEGYGAGVQGTIPPGSRQTVKTAYKVSKSQLNPAVITAGSVVWQGDFATFQR
ncbi:hypothetical protein [Nocardia cerradoensis]|uniref:DUF4352 domain-containing protein n=1 Tax=Nocardia cerradoensis TaxID=85688 RepID=A0A231GST4_9NOCA|nr:hypothetical protein [Nocardia cerradoensis]NKY48024.1 hypothetical protein [Nocardia cerradoensis]OXR39683.1 hypothetical protein B7C42_08241 [Nocardia cerradoensis]